MALAKLRRAAELLPPGFVHSRTLIFGPAPRTPRLEPRLRMSGKPITFLVSPALWIGDRIQTKGI